MFSFKREFKRTSPVLLLHPDSSIRYSIGGSMDKDLFDGPLVHYLVCHVVILNDI